MRGGCTAAGGPRLQGGARLPGVWGGGGAWVRGGLPGCKGGAGLWGQSPAGVGGPQLRGGVPCLQKGAQLWRGVSPEVTVGGGSPQSWSGSWGVPSWRAGAGGRWGGRQWELQVGGVQQHPAWGSCTAQSWAKSGGDTHPLGRLVGAPSPSGAPPTAPTGCTRGCVVQSRGRAWSPWAGHWGQRSCRSLGTEGPAHPGGVLRPQNPPGSSATSCCVLLDVLEGWRRDAFSRRMVIWKPGQGCMGGDSGPRDPGDTQRSHRPRGWGGG